MKIQKDTLVTMSVQMYDLQKNLLETAEDLAYWHGHGDIFPVIEAALEGKQAGETLTIELEPEEAFGDYDDSALIIRPETDFDEGVEVGLQYTEIRGETLDRVYRVTDVAEGVVVLDGNHPLAGYGLHFEIKIKDVAPAKAEMGASDDVVVPNFLQITDKKVDVFDSDEEDDPTATRH